MSRILLIDDELSSRLVMHNRLKDLGHDVVIAENGAKGLLEVRESPFDLILIDAGLSAGVSGLEVCRRMRQIPQASHVPIIVVSRQPGAREEAHKAFESGCDAFITKSEMPVLDDVLRALLRNKAMFDEQTRQLRAVEDNLRRLSESQQQEGGEVAAGGDTAGSSREGGSPRPDGILLVDADGILRYADRGARDLFGGGLEGKNLGRLAPASGLEAFVRDARTEAREGFRFDLPTRNGRAGRALLATVVPLIATPGSKDPELRVVLVLDNAKRKLQAELVRMQDYVIPRREVGVLLDAARAAFGPAAIVGTSETAARLRAAVNEAARASQPLLLIGETGTGKTHLARALHFSGDQGGPFLQVSCAGLSPENLESELFGHVRGAFEGVAGERPGLFQQGAHGTIYLEDVDQMSAPLQERLLRAIQEGKVTRAGTERAESVDVRVIASSAFDLDDRVREGSFRGDLAAVLNQGAIHVAPLRQRREDIPVLAQHFLERTAAGRPGLEVSDRVLWTLENHDWPGNVRELESCIRRACQLATESDLVEIEHLPAPLVELSERLPSREVVPTQPAQPARVALGADFAGAARPSAGEARHEPFAERSVSAERGGPRQPWEISPEDPPSLELYEMKALLHALDKTRGDKLAAARLLKVGKSTLYRKLKRYGIS